MHPNSLLRSKLVHAAVALTALIWLFEFVPPTSPTLEHEAAGKQLKPPKQLPPHLMIIKTVQDTATRLVNSLPSYAGFWTVYEPHGNFHPLAPSGEIVRAEAESMLKYIRSLQKRTFFRIFKVDLNQECPFWARENLCSASAGGSCSVCECAEDEVPTYWREKPTEHFVSTEDEITPWQDQKSSLMGSVGQAESDFLDTLSGATRQSTSYVDLVRNQPGFTAYKGRNIWRLIYKDNCIRNADKEVFDPRDRDFVPTCSDEDVYERIISGLQTTIMVLSSEYNKPYTGQTMLPILSAQHEQVSRVGLSSDKGDDSSMSNRYSYDLEMYRQRVNIVPRWIDNMYLDFSILLRTLSRLSSIFNNCNCYTGTDADDVETKALLSQLIDYVRENTESGSPVFTQMPIFTRKQDLAIMQMNNISRIFDCIECEKCRLHGKVKLTALQIAIKTLPGNGSQQQPITSLERNEICALINALGYFADAISITHKMKSRVLALRRLVATASIWIAIGLVEIVYAIVKRFMEAKRGTGESATKLLVTDKTEKVGRR